MNHPKSLIDRYVYVMGITTQIAQIDDIAICNVRKPRDYIMRLPHYKNLSKQKQLPNATCVMHGTPVGRR